MILNNPQLNSKATRNRFLRDITGTKQGGNNQVRRLIELVREGGQIAMLLLKLLKLSKKVKVLALEREDLLRERRDLIIQKRDLHIEKVDHVFAQASGAADKMGFVGNL